MPVASAKIKLGRLVLLGAAALLFSAGCTMVGYQSPPVSPAMRKYSKANSALLERGYVVHQAKCAKCHPFEDPARYTPDELRTEVMPPMARKSKLDAADEQAVLEYLLAARQLPQERDAETVAP